MRRLLLLLSLVTLAASVPLTAAAAQSSDDYSNVRIVRLSFLEGEAQIFRPENGDWEEARLNLPIQKAYALATGRGRAEIEFESGATVRLDENSELEFVELALVGGARVTTLRLESGNAFFYASLDKHDTFEVLSGPYRIRVPRNARLRVSSYRDETIVSVLKGNVDVEGDSQTYRVAKNEELRLTTAFGAEVARREGNTEFEQWALDREEVLTASNESQRYVNAPFRYGVGDLSRYGYWTNYAGYGNVWYPYATGFAPYVNGQWYWVSGFGWTWAGFEPWGWLPYHFGSWMHTPFGWAWVPGNFYRPWHPGYVTWVRFGDGSFGWCPRNPHDRPGHRPRHNPVVTATFNGPVVRNEDLGGVGVVLDGGPPTREDVEGRPGFGSRNPRIDRASRGGRGGAESGVNTDTTVSTGVSPRNGGAGPRNGFSGSTGTGTADTPRVGTREPGGRGPQPRGDVRFDRDENRYVNTPVRDPDATPRATPRSGFSGSTDRPRPNFPRDDSPRAVDRDSRGSGAGAGAGTATGAGTGRGAGSSYGTGAQPRTDSSTPRSSGSGYSGRAPQSSGRSESAPRATPAPSQQPRQSSPPPRATPPASQPRQSSPPPQAQPRQSSPPPQARPSSPPPRPSTSSFTRPAPRPSATPRPAPKQPNTSS